ncbi:alpha/beta hydrolase fold domain-containing protein [Aquimarina litoralis]|uniref:alpha/beta hydrolase fold domain-containing protein n=1 Tax=Aquimarina litoralis TaxID=584605 RepID=UPI001C59552F|nr:alpha/beta hydrolase [Aquimarina litoralis]MBW1298983.1 alpha/beta hydrolase fold domain-containing protein [Aquimarina litoralis]
MAHSFTYHLTLLIIKLKGIKNKFSQDPIDFMSVRKEDMFFPKGAFFKKNINKRFQILKTTVTEIGQNNNTGKLLLFIHGGAFISGPAKHHWDTIKTIAQKTNYTIWMCNYPKAPEHKISEISKNIDSIYDTAINRFKSNKIVLIGDSVGGTLITALTQRLIVQKKTLPSKLILVSPVMDASMSNKAIDTVDAIDPMLSTKGLLSAKKMCIEDGDLKNELISPIYGSFELFPKTLLYAAENDITYPDQLLAFEKAKKANVDIECIKGIGMPHIWPFLPVMKEAKNALNQLIKVLD